VSYALTPLLEVQELARSSQYDPVEILIDLDQALEHRQWDLEHYGAYYNGRHTRRFNSEKWAMAFGGQFRQFADNWCQLVVDAVEERLKVEGFRFGGEEADTDTWDIWQRNFLDADSKMAHTAALVGGVSYALVWYDDDDKAEVKVESAQQVIVAYAAGDRRRRVAGMKRWLADDETVFATLYMPDYLWKFQAKSAGGSERPAPMLGGWEPREVGDEPWPLPNPLDIVPIVPLINRPRLLPLGAIEGDSEISQLIPLQDAVNAAQENLMVAAEYQAFRQRWVTGLDIPTDPETGQPIEPFRAAIDRLFVAENPETRFGEFGQADLGQYVKQIEMYVQHIASQTRTPPHYFYLSGQFPSGESIKSAETGLVAKVRDKQVPFGEGWEEVMRLCHAVEDDDRALYARAETIWADPESRSEGEHVDATLKKKSLEVPWLQLMRDLGYSPEQIREMRAMRTEDQFLNAALALAQPQPAQPAQPPPLPGPPR
jgi:Phage portal protein, SPP1 Gp6-like